MAASPDAFFRCVWAQTEKGNALRVTDCLTNASLKPDAKDDPLRA